MCSTGCFSSVDEPNSDFHLPIPALSLRSPGTVQWQCPEQLLRPGIYRLEKLFSRFSDNHPTRSNLSSLGNGVG